MMLSSCLSNRNSTGVQLSVFSGDCNALQCIRAEQQQCEGAIGWATETDENYYILASTSLRDTEYELSLEQGVDNDICETAEALDPVPIREANSNTTIFRSLHNATADTGLPSCSESSDEEESLGTGVWFSVLGTGSLFRVSTCSADYSSSNASISVYSGPCAKLECVDGISKSCGSSNNEVSWVTKPSVAYVLLVRGATSFGPDVFELSIEEVVSALMISVKRQHP
jgi:hypothetical protein